MHLHIVFVLLYVLCMSLCLCSFVCVRHSIFYVCVTCCDLYVTINLSETEREKARGNNNDLSYVPSKKNKKIKRNLWLWLLCCSSLPTCNFHRPFTLGSSSLLGVESLSWSGVFFFFDLTVDGDGRLLFLIIGLEGSYSEWSESEAAGHHLELQVGFGQVGVPVVEQKGQEMKEAVLSMSGKRFWKKTCTSSKVVCPSDRSLQLNKKPVVILYPLWLWWWPHFPNVQKVGSQSLVLVINCNGGNNMNDQHVSDNTMWFCKKRYGFTTTGRKRFLWTAYLENKCKYYTRLMFLIQEMLIVMAVKD